ncbi:MAG: hypothetical protein E7351_00530 [Clostridiales bacterium]|nr:hypothetical protein [Clostridiales bacterium]
MNQNTKVKLMIIGAITLIVSLFVISIIQIVQINKAKEEIAKQREQIEQLNKEIDFYKNKAVSTTDYIIEITRYI